MPEHSDADLPHPADAADRLVFLDRQGCHLCAQAWPVVAAEAARAGTGVDRRDVDEDPQLAARFGDQVPVVILDHRIHARYRVDARQLRAALAPGPRWRRLLPF
ncbi:MAG: glutaredoxin family protein [Brachybacterium sp.]|nr:glutaredoxin family protein [Brachybacterium sp.]